MHLFVGIFIFSYEKGTMVILCYTILFWCAQWCRTIAVLIYHGIYILLQHISNKTRSYKANQKYIQIYSHNAKGAKDGCRGIASVFWMVLGSWSGVLDFYSILPPSPSPEQHHQIRRWYYSGGSNLKRGWSCLYKWDPEIVRVVFSQLDT